MQRTLPKKFRVVAQKMKDLVDFLWTFQKSKKTKRLNHKIFTILTTDNVSKVNKYFYIPWKVSYSI